jgi:hypothetical protein
MAPYHTICGSLELLNGEKAHVLAGWWVFIALSDQVVVPVKSTKKTWPLDLPTHNWIISHYPQDTMVTIVLLCQDTMTIRCVSCSQGCSDECVVQVSTTPRMWTAVFLRQVYGDHTRLMFLHCEHIRGWRWWECAISSYVIGINPLAIVD